MRFVITLILISCLLFVGCKKRIDTEDINEFEAQKNYENYIKLLTDHNRPRYDYFPAGIFDANEGHDKFTNRWYGSHLTALGEPSIYIQKDDEKKKIFRFTWLRTFHKPISIRLEIQEDGTGLLYCRVTNGAGGYEPSKIMKSYKKRLHKRKVRKFLELVNKSGFWDMSTNKESYGLDGAQWIIEGLSDGRYHLVDRWSPKKGGARKIGLELLKLSGLWVIDIY